MNIKKFLKKIRPFYRWINRLKGFRIHDETIDREYVVLGSEYGGWAIDPSEINSNSIIYSVGVGEDITFDLELIDLFNCQVHAFDPTPIAVEYISKIGNINNFIFHHIGLGAEDDLIDFQIPPISGWHSFSLTPDFNAAQVGSVKCKVQTLESIMIALGHQKIDVLKMDIEGFEYSVVENILSSNIKPKQLLIEFHHKIYQHSVLETKISVKKLIEFGYEIFWISDAGHEYGFYYTGDKYLRPKVV